MMEWRGNKKAKRKVAPGLEPGLPECLMQVKIWSDNHYTTQPWCLMLEFLFAHIIFTGIGLKAVPVQEQLHLRRQSSEGRRAGFAETMVDSTCIL